MAHTSMTVAATQLEVILGLVNAEQSRSAVIQRKADGVVRVNISPTVSAEIAYSGDLIATPDHIERARAAGHRAGWKAAKHAMSNAVTRDVLCRHLAEHDAVPDCHAPEAYADQVARIRDARALTIACNILDLDRQIIADHGGRAMAALAVAWEEAASAAYEARVRALAVERQVNREGRE